MNTAPHHPPATTSAIVKVVYLLLSAVLLFAIDNPWFILAMLLLHLALWVFSSVPMQRLAKLSRRLGLFFLLITLSYAFFPIVPGHDQWLELPLGLFTVSINLDGILLALLMCLRVLALILISSWIQASGKPEEFVQALVSLKFPHFAALALDASLALLSGQQGKGQDGGKGDGSGRGRRRHKERAESGGMNFRQIFKGDFGFVPAMVERGLGRAEHFLQERYPGMDARQLRDLTIVVGTAVTVMGLKVIQIMPGLPIAPGHKNILIIPFFLLASQLTHSRFGGFWAGLTTGIVSFLLGYGKFGILEILPFLVPGLLADLLLPLVRGEKRWLRLLQFVMIGALLGFGRFAANILVIVLAGSPELAFVLILPLFFSQVGFGALSGFVAVVLLAAIKDIGSLRKHGASPEAGETAGGKGSGRGQGGGKGNGSGDGKNRSETDNTPGPLAPEANNPNSET